MEKAPWWGGFWEHLVRSIKNCIRKILGRSTLNFEELCTLLIEVEATLNNRLLMYLYDDENGISYPLTPASLIYGRTVSQAVNETHMDIVSTNRTLTQQAKYHFKLLDQFIQQWSKEYLLSLHEKSSAKSFSHNSSATFSVGDMVLIRE